MAELALSRSPSELADSRLEVAALAGHHGVRGDQVKSRRGVLCDESGRPPVDLTVTALAIKPERRGVRIGVTSAAAPDQIVRDRPAVVVASQAGRSVMRALQRPAGFFLMVE
jgi:hypothetical protein